MRTIDITNSDDVIDVRDVIERFEQLTDDKAATDAATWAADHTDEEAELVTLAELLDELEGNGGDEQWRGNWYPVTLVRDSYFTDYARELLEDCGDLPKDLPHYIAIDWAATARNIRVDYSSTEFAGVTYWYR